MLLRAFLQEKESGPFKIGAHARKEQITPSPPLSEHLCSQGVTDIARHAPTYHVYRSCSNKETTRIGRRSHVAERQRVKARAKRPARAPTKRTSAKVKGGTKKKEEGTGQTSKGEKGSKYTAGWLKGAGFRL